MYYMDLYIHDITKLNRLIDDLQTENQDLRKELKSQKNLDDY